MIFRKLKAATTLATLLIVLFVGAMLVAPAPVQADHCAKKESKSCDKSESSDEKKGCDKGKGGEEKGGEEKGGEEKKGEEKKGCDKSEK
jgi:hypothetical protein